jgi:hypothetical protein
MLALSNSYSIAQSVFLVASTLSTTTTNMPLGTTSWFILILLFLKLLDTKDKICNKDLITEMVGKGSLLAL